MSTITQSRRRNSVANTQPAISGDWALFMAASVNYFIGGKPKYKLVQEFVTVPVINQPDNAYDSAADARNELKNREAAVCVSEFEGRDVYSLGIRNDMGGMQFAGLIHNANGPLTDKSMRIVEVEATEDIAFDDVVVVAKGKRLIKAVTAEYLTKIKEAA